MAEPQVEIEIAWPRPEGPRSWRLRLPAGSTAADALATVVLAEEKMEEKPAAVKAEKKAVKVKKEKKASKKSEAKPAKKHKKEVAGC